MNYKKVKLIRNLILIICLLGIQTIYAQSKKEARENKTKSTTVWQTEYEKGASKTFKESYEEFDKLGNSILKIDYKKDGSVKKKLTSVYDKYNKKIEENESNAEDNSFKRTTFIYNSDGEKISEIIYDAKGTIIKKHLFKYNPQNYKLEKQTYNNAGELESLKKWVYDSYK